MAEHTDGGKTRLAAAALALGLIGRAALRRLVERGAVAAGDLVAA